MTKLNKARIQRLDPKTGTPIEDVDVLTSADCVNLDSGETVEAKLGAIDNITTARADKILDSILPNKPSVKPNNFYNKQEVDDRIQEEIDKAQLDGCDIDLEPYATKNYVEAVVKNIELTPGPKGEAGEQGKDGVEGKPGRSGATGAPGKTPVFKTTDEGFSWKYNSDLEVVANVDAGDNIIDIYGNDVIKKMKLNDGSTKGRFYKILQVEGFIGNEAGEVMMILKLDHQSQGDTSFLKAFDPKGGIKKIPTSKTLDVNLDMDAVVKEFMRLAKLTPLPPHIDLKKMDRFDVKLAIYDREKRELNNNLMIFMISEDKNDWVSAVKFSDLGRAKSGVDFWIGTQEEYDALEKDDRTLYIIEDEENEN